MFKGFYNLTSGMLTQQRNLDVISNNISNLSTTGYKGETYTASTFDEVMYQCVGTRDKSSYSDLGTVSYLRATDEICTDFTQGVVEETGLPLDFALDGDGFFAIRSADGEVAYTRMGSFSLDDEGYLCLADYGRVLDNEGNEIFLATDKLVGDSHGYLYAEDGGWLLGQVGVYSFEDNTALERNAQGLFTGENAQPYAEATVCNGRIERSNVSMVDQMTEMMSAQRSFQSAAQLIQMYNEVMTKAATEVGRLQ